MDSSSKWKNTWDSLTFLKAMIWITRVLLGLNNTKGSLHKNSFLSRILSEIILVPRSSKIWRILNFNPDMPKRSAKMSVTERKWIKVCFNSQIKKEKLTNQSQPVLLSWILLEISILNPRTFLFNNRLSDKNMKTKPDQCQDIASSTRFQVLII
jgi:hypothetical protein